MNVDELLDLLDETLEESTNLPFTGGKRMVDVDKVRDIIDDVRLNMPTEIKQAKAIVNDRAEIVAGARREAEGARAPGRFPPIVPRTRAAGHRWSLSRPKVFARVPPRPQPPRAILVRTKGGAMGARSSGAARSATGCRTTMSGSLVPVWAL